MKTAVESVFVGKDRQFNRRFLQMCGHYLVEPTACTPASGWEKGQVENQVGNLRERLFTPRVRVTSYEELNAWLLDRCVAYAKANRHPELTDQTIWQVFEAERAKLVPISSRFDGFRATQVAVSKTCLVRFDNNKYSVTARAVGRPVEIQALTLLAIPTACTPADVNASPATSGSAKKPSWSGECPPGGSQRQRSRLPNTTSAARNSFPTKANGIPGSVTFIRLMSPVSIDFANSLSPILLIIAVPGGDACPPVDSIRLVRGEIKIEHPARLV